MLILLKVLVLKLHIIAHNPSIIDSQYKLQAYNHQSSNLQLWHKVLQTDRIPLPLKKRKEKGKTKKKRKVTAAT